MTHLLSLRDRNDRAKTTRGQMAAFGAPKG
jgi:hypothetical protein